MRSLHEITQQWLCRILFVVAGVLPMLAVLAWSATIQTPWHKAATERRLAESLDLDVEIAAAEFPLPAVSRFQSLKLSDPHSERLIAQFDSLEIRESDSGWMVSSDGVVVERESLGVLTHWLARTIQRRSGTTPENVHVSFTNVQFSDGDTAKCKITSEWTREDEVVRLNVILDMEDAGSGTRVAMAALFDRGDSQRNVRFVLDTQGNSLACSSVAAVAPGVRSFGDEATFQGKLWARLPTEKGLAPERWLVDAMTGRLANVDLSQVTQVMGDKILDTRADVTIRGALFEDGRLVKAAGELDAEQGTVDAALMGRLVNEFQLRSKLNNTEQLERLGFDRLALAFAVDRQGVLIEGRANNSLAIISSERGTIATQPSCEPVPLVSMLQAVAPPGSPLVPVATAAPWLAELLPSDSEAKRR